MLSLQPNAVHWEYPGTVVDDGSAAPALGAINAGSDHGDHLSPFGIPTRKRV